MNSDNLILRQTDFPPLVNKNDFIDSSEFDANFTNIYEDLVALCVTSGVLNFDVDTEYDDEVNQFAMHDGRLYRFIFATPTSNVTPGKESSEAYWLEIFPTDLAHRKNSDKILAEGTASQVTASEIRAFIDAGLTSTTNLSITEHTSTTFKLNSSTGADVVIPQATPTEAGLLNSEDKVKLQQLSGENSGDQTLESLGAEAEANKVDNLDTPNTTTYPTTNAVSTALSAAKSDIVGAAPSNLNTLEELSNAIGNDPDFADSVTTQLGGKEASLPSMVGNALKVLRVNAGATAKEWYELPAEGITIGTTPITSGTAGRVLFQSGGVVSQSSKLTFDGSLLKLIGTDYINTNNVFNIRNYTDDRNLIKVNGLGKTDWGFDTAGLDMITIEPQQSRIEQTAYGGLKIMSLSPSEGYLGHGVGAYKFGIGANTPQARLDVKAQGALSTDIAFRVRNSADTSNLFTVKGNGVLNAANLPTSPSGLVTGDIWNNSGILTIV